MPTKIATAEDVQSELRTLLAMTEEPNPSRAKLAAALDDLANRVSGIDRVDGQVLDSLEEELDKIKQWAGREVAFYGKADLKIRALQKTWAEKEEPSVPSNPRRAAYLRALENTSNAALDLKESIQDVLTKSISMASEIEDLRRLWS